MAPIKPKVLEIFDEGAEGWRGHQLGDTPASGVAQGDYEFMESRNSPLVFIGRSLLSKNSMESMTFSGCSN